MFAALLASVAHYIYFRFVDQGFILNAYENLLNTFTDKTLPDMDKYIDSLKESLNVLRSLSPIDITMQLISKNVFYGTLLAIPTALMISTVNRK